jgi:hypothetical protein
MSIIYETTNYDQFKSFESNRPVESSQIIESIKKNNLLKSHPIIVTKDFYVIDGQHRLDAARKLKIPIYYIQDLSLTEEDISTCQISKPWTIENFCHFYKSKNEDYEFLFQMSRKYNTTISRLLGWCSKSFEVLLKYKQGKYKISYSKEFLEEKIEKFKQIRDAIFQITKRKLLKNGEDAIWNIISMENYEHEVFLYKIDMYPSFVKAAVKFNTCLDIKEALIETIYNRNNKSEAKKLFVYKPEATLSKK